MGKSIIILAGAGYGIVTALDAFRVSEKDQANEAHPVAQHWQSLDQRLDRISETLDTLSSARPEVQTTAPRPVQKPIQYVTREDLNASLEQLSRRIHDDLETRLEVQDRSVQALREMIARTDELLEQVLESIESTGVQT